MRAKAVVVLSAPSKTVRETSALPVADALGVTVTVRLAPLPPRTIAESGTSAVFEEIAETTRRDAAVWVSPMMNGIGPVEERDSTVREAGVVTVGGRFFGVTVRAKAREVVSAPSETWTVMVADPDRVPAGVTVTVRLAPLPPKTIAERGTSVVFEEEPVTTSREAAVCVSPMVNAIAPVEAGETTVREARVVTEGGRLAWVTVSTNVVLVVRAPSDTRMVRVAVPGEVPGGVTVIVRLAPLPRRTIAEAGTSDKFDDVAVTVRLAAGVAESPTVNGIAPVEALATTLRLTTLETVGGVLGFACSGARVRPVTVPV